MNVGFIGVGNMGRMLVASLARSEVIQPSEIYASNRSQDKLTRLVQDIPGLRMAYTNTELVQHCGTVFLCVKPSETKAVLEEIGPYITAGHLLAIITNTLDISAVEQVVRGRVAKVIPSLLHTIDEGISLLMFGERCTLEDRALLHRLMGAISRPLVIEERQARVASDLTSCGPAFLSYALRSFAQAAQRYETSLPPDTIDAVIRHTVKATCDLMERYGLSFDDIIARVSTPGGVTAEGIKVLDEGMAGVWEQVIETTIRKEACKKAKVKL